MAVSRKKVVFKNRQGENLAALLEMPAGAPTGFVLFAHCFTCGKDIASASRISRALASRGLATLRFDFTGLGGSDGDFANTNFSSNVDDLISAVEFLRAEYVAPAILVGHSLGGAAVLAAASAVPEAVAVVTIGAPADPEHVRKQFSVDVDQIEAQGEATVSLAGRPFLIKKQFLDDIADQSMEAKIKGLRKALLVFHSPVDSTVSIEQAAKIYQSAMHPKSFISLDHADHLLTKKEDAEYVAATIVSWVTRYMEDKLGESSQERKDINGQVFVGERNKKFLRDILTDDHFLHADEPNEVGGSNIGPDPYELLLASLGACTSMTIRMYANRKDWPLENVEVHLSHDRVHSKDCEACEEQAGMVDRIERLISFQGQLDSEQQAKLLEIADKCPVHKTLHNQIVIPTKLAE